MIEKKKTFTYTATPSVRDKAKKKAAKEGYTLSAVIEMKLREYIKPKKFGIQDIRAAANNFINNM